MAHPGPLVPPFEPFRHRYGILDMPLHPQAQRLEALQEEEGIEGGNGRARVAQILQPGLEDEASGEEGLWEIAEHEPVVVRVGFGESGESAATLVVKGAH